MMRAQRFDLLHLPRRLRVRFDDTGVVLVVAQTSTEAFTDQLSLSASDADTFVSVVAHPRPRSFLWASNWGRSRQNASCHRRIPSGMFGAVSSAAGVSTSER